MELTIKTSELQEMVGKASKCVSNNKLIPLTSLMNIKVKDNILTLTTTDATNYFYSSSLEKLDCEDFEVSVMADLFTKLIQKTTSENITIILDGNTVKVKGNGTYVMELPLDENGSIIKFPNKLNEDFKKVVGQLKLSTIKAVLLANKPSLAVNMDYPSLTCYYCGDKVVTSDRKKICRTAVNFFDEPYLISSQLMELLGSLDSEDIDVTTFEGNLIFSTSKDIIFAPIQEGVNTFPVVQIEKLIEQDFKSRCKISKSAILNIIERLSLFVVPYDKHGIYLTFSNEGILLSSKKSSGQELIPFIESENFEPYTCCIDIEMLRSQIASAEEENLDLYYGSDIAIKLCHKNIMQIVALLEDDRMEA